MIKGSEVITDRYNNKYVIVGPFLQEVDSVPVHHGYHNADRVVLLYQIGRALRHPNRRLDALYTQCGLISSTQAGGNVNEECFSVLLYDNGSLWVGCRHFVGDDAEKLIAAAKKAWANVKK